MCSPHLAGSGFVTRVGPGTLIREFSIPVRIGSEGAKKGFVRLVQFLGLARERSAWFVAFSEACFSLLDAGDNLIWV